MKNKKASHVGIVLSFVIFVTFIFFIFSVLNPAVEQEKGKQLIIEVIKENLLQNLSSNLSVTSLKLTLNEQELPDCFELSDFFATQENTKVKDESGNNVGFTISPGKIYINREGNTFFKIYHSNEFLTDSTRDSCGTLNPNDYIIGITRTDKYIFETKILDIINKYNSSYQDLKDNLGISDANEFGISFINVTGDETKRGFESVSGNVYIDEIPISYYNSNAEIKSGVIKIRVW